MFSDCKPAGRARFEIPWTTGELGPFWIVDKGRLCDMANEGDGAVAVFGDDGDGQTKIAAIWHSFSCQRAVEKDASQSSTTKGE